MPVGLILSPIILGWSIGTTFVAEHTAAGITFCGSSFTIALPFSLSISESSLINSGFVPQHPPNTLIPYFLKSFINSAKSFGPTLYSFVCGSGSPALGLTTTGRLVHFVTSSITGSNSFGPSEQLTPMASTPSPSRVSAIDGTIHPVNVLLFISNVIVHIIGRSEFSFAASTAAFTSSRSVIVSNTTRSAPALLPAFTTSAYISYASSKLKVPVGSKSWPIGPTSSATSASGLTLSLAVIAFLIPAVTSSSTLCPHSSSL